MARASSPPRSTARPRSSTRARRRSAASRRPSRSTATSTRSCRPWATATAQIRELAETIAKIDCDLIVSATPIDLNRLITDRQPMLPVGYELEEIGSPNLEDVLQKF